jgi:hypothetical protein
LKTKRKNFCAHLKIFNWLQTVSSVAFNSALIEKKIKTNEQNSENFFFHPLNLGSGSFSFERDFLECKQWKCVLLVEILI